MNKKSISIITIHSIYNYGSALQSYATQKFINDLGYDAKLIDYRPKYDRSLKRLIKDLAIIVLFFNKYFKRKKNYDDFHYKKMKLSSKMYKTYDELIKNPPISDIYISGSDQVWNTYFPCGKDPAYTLEFVKNENKISYAASMGRSDMSIDDLKRLANRIADYKWISMREQSGVDQLKKVGVGSINVSDPVFLLSANYYRTISVKSKFRNYILVYSVHQSKELSDIVEEYKRRLGLDVVLVGDFPVKCYHDISLKEAGPLEFLGLINGADFIITNSFHCVSFSLILEKQFIAVMPKVNTSRISNILGVAGLNSRAYENILNLPGKLEKIDYKKVTPRVSKYAEYSRKELSNILLIISNEEKNAEYECV